MPRNPLEKNNDPRPLASLPRPQKIAVLSLSLLAILIVFSWAWQFRANINRPFKVEIAKNTNSTTVDPRQQDTDGDGLSDYDEVNVYKTSPYLEDTDSDNILDKKEVEQGSDPNCPAGRNCNVVTTESNSPTGTNVDTNPTLSDNLNSSGTPEVILQNALSGQIDAAGLRQLLLDAGGDKATLDQISDAELMTIYQESLQNQATQAP